MRDKSAAVHATPRSRLASQKTGTTAPRIVPAEFGERLLRGREQKERSLQEIADATKITIHQLRALERGDLDRLPTGIYRRAIVRQYAEAVGLNVEETIRDLADVSADADVHIESLEEFARPRGDAGSSSFTTALWSSAAAFVAVGVAAALATSWYRSGTAAPAAPLPALTAASAPAPETEAPAIALVAATEAVEPAVSQPQPHPPTPTLTETQTEPDSVAGANATEGELRIMSEPSGAQVTVNGVGWGPTPVTIQYMPFGTKLIRATKPGYVSAQRVFDFVPDRRARSVRIQLSPAPDAR